MTFRIEKKIQFIVQLLQQVLDNVGRVRVYRSRNSYLFVVGRNLCISE